MSASVYQMFEQISFRSISFLQQNVLFVLILLPIIALTSFLLRKRSPQLHFGLWTLLLLRLILPTDLSLPFGAGHFLTQTWPQLAATFSTPSFETTQSARQQAGIESHPFSVAQTSAHATPANHDFVPSWYLWAFIIWGFGACSMALLFLQRWLSLNRALRAARPVEDKNVLHGVALWRRRFRMRRRVRVVSSEAFDSPFTAGWRHPFIYLPAALLTPEQHANVQAVLAHEMAHIKRMDVLWLRLQNIVQIIYFFFPVAWWISRQLNNSRESICDRMVLAENVLRPIQYAKSMIAVLRLNLVANQPLQTMPAFGSDRSYFRHRIRDIFSKNATQKTEVLPVFALVIFVGLVLLPLAPNTEMSNHPARLFAAPQLQEQENKFVKPVSNLDVTAKFGKLQANKPFHKGIDFRARHGSDVFAFADGIIDIAQTSYDKNQGYGKKIVVSHADSLQSVYAHLSEILVEAGEKIKAGQVIGKVGSTGKSTGPHLHFETLKNGEYVDPANYIDLQ